MTREEFKQKLIDKGYTKEQAESCLTYYELTQDIEWSSKYAKLNFNENQKEKWSVIYDFSYNKVDCVYNKYTKYIPFEACFKTKEDCQKAIDTIGVDNLKKYYFDIAKVEEDK